MTAGVLQQACDCVLSVDILAVRINAWALLGACKGKSVRVLVFVSFEAAVREAVLRREDREAEVARAIARIILWGCICQASLMCLLELGRSKLLPRRDDVTACHRQR